MGQIWKQLYLNQTAPFCLGELSKGCTPENQPAPSESAFGCPDARQAAEKCSNTVTKLKLLEILLPAQCGS